jgi:uncharacterized protein (TIGR00297 family)
MLFSYTILLSVLILVAVICVRIKKLTPAAGFTAVLMGLLVFAGGGLTGILLMGSFFVSGVLATAHRKDLKAKMQPDGFHPQARNAGQVLANGGVAALLSALALIDPAHAGLYLVMLVASLAAAASDTISSELGMVYGHNTFNILTFKREAPGLDGVISLEGTLLGAAASALIALLYSIMAGFSKAGLIIAVAGLLGNLADSVLGAALERKRFIGNDAVNFLNTLFAALVALLLMAF